VSGVVPDSARIRPGAGRGDEADRAREGGNEHEDSLRTANWTARVALLVLLGFFTFVAHWPGDVQGGLEIAAVAVTAVVLALWALADRTAQTRARYLFLLPYGLGAITAICSVASVGPTGRPLIYLGLVATVAAGSDTPQVAGGIVTGLGILGCESAGLARGAGTWITVGYPIILLGGLLLGRNRWAQRVQAEQAATLLVRSEQLREEQAQVATLQERTRLAREIHDVLAHSLGALGLHIQVIRAVLTDQHDPDRAVELLDKAHRMATDGLNETRRAVHALRGETLPLPQSLAELSADHERRHETPVRFEVTGAPRRLSHDAGLAITRTAQEALVNTAKHAPRQPVEIHLDYSDASTSLTVSNRLGDGQDHDGSQPELATVNSGYGLAGMRERLLLLDGSLSAGPSGGDWVVRAKVPQ